ncbi:heterokaryon incompatibility protein-domain-containing protein [Hypoxylon fuscum]|nr:heterokaryon incompatibility protein-domain-containing protein [Hypoxylon fuscum]
MDSQAYGRSGDLSSSLYQPLDRERKEMRLLEVSPGNRGEIVKARLIYASLLNPEDIDYETISYAWGDATKLDDVNINGRVIDVPASSAAAIKCMRKLDTPRRLWIDAICINQDDLAERGHQVSIMSEIYKSSRQNLVYLGEEDETAENAFDSLRRVYQEIERKTNGKSGFRTKISQFSRGETEPIDCEFDEIAINALLKREWFKRLWVVQEVALAPSSICFCGSKLSIELVSVIRVLPWLRYHRQTTIDLMQAVGLWLVVEGKAKWSVCWLMVSTEHFLASELRDKIFAIAGLVPNPAENLRRPDPALISTDYSKPLSHVYRDATRYAIQEEGKLNVLQFVRHRCDGDELDLGEFPSWVPRLDIPFDKIYDPYPFVSNEFKADSNYQVPGYTIQCNYSGPETLSLVGYEVTCIRRASDVFSNTALRSPETCAAILRSIAEQYQTTKKILSIDEKSRTD